MVDYKGGGNLLYLPLDKLHAAAAPRRRCADAQAPRAAGAETPAPRRRMPAPRSRDALRGRDRGER